MNEHMHCEKCGKIIYKNEKPIAYVNTNLIWYNILCKECVDALGGCDDGT